MSKLRFDVVQDAFKKRALEVVAPASLPSKYFGELVFNREMMRKYLDIKVYEALVDCIDNGTPLDLSIADEVADGMKEWALSHGVTHITIQTAKHFKKDTVPQAAAAAKILLRKVQRSTVVS